MQDKLKKKKKKNNKKKKQTKHLTKNLCCHGNKSTQPFWHIWTMKFILSMYYFIDFNVFSSIWLCIKSGIHIIKIQSDFDKYFIHSCEDEIL